MPSSTTIPETGPELLTLPQAAALCNVSQRTLWGWAVAGISPPPLKIGKGTVRYSRRAYEKWVAAGCPSCNGGRADG
jgi:predicted DNA-binding transcriptional regulator AlpA